MHVIFQSRIYYINGQGSQWLLAFV